MKTSKTRTGTSRLSHRTLALFALAISLALPSGNALAVGELTCVASSEISYSPGLRLFTQQTDITFDTGYSGCTSLTGSPIISGSRSGSFSGPRSCLALPPSGSALVEVTWSNGQISVVDATSQSTDAAGQTIHLITGPIISGPFTGRTFNEQIVQASLDLLYCLTAPGVTFQSGTGVMEIL
ncbi:hypothetical protein [Microbulbifer litoralis]|uniref:hypothetical protein n=1 Tax=Microbulbifer litoralis TaxID=2933965 RepID=UPI002027A1DB|nr:hypothetical protein [Microbulbifer sp. GX H0434]